MTAPAAVTGVASAMSRVDEIRARFSSPVGSRPTASAVGVAASPAGALDAVSDDFAAMLMAATGRTALAPALPRGSVAGLPVGGPDQGGALVDRTMRYLGVPYVWGGTDPAVGLDCSGFVQLVHREMGIELPRVSRDQARAGQPVASLAEARPGDVLVFGEPVNHVAIYAGDGQMVHAPRRGDVVTHEAIDRPITGIRRFTAAAPPSGVASFGPTATGAAASLGPAPFAEMFAAAGARHGVDPRILSAVARVESGYDPSAVSRAGARGLMQFMPATAAGMGIDPMDPEQAVDGAARYLSEQIRDFGSLDLALAAYNAGPGAVRRHGGVPPYAETQAYVRKVNDILHGGS